MKVMTKRLLEFRTHIKTLTKTERRRNEQKIKFYVSFLRELKKHLNGDIPSFRQSYHQHHTHYIHSTGEISCFFSAFLHIHR
jgi:hypothetical protein